MGKKDDVIHRLIDAVTGKANIAPHEADGLHDAITPGYSAVPLTAEQEAQLAALQAQQKVAADKAAKAAEPEPEPVTPYQKQQAEAAKDGDSTDG